METLRWILIGIWVASVIGVSIHVGLICRRNYIPNKKQLIFALIFIFLSYGSILIWAIEMEFYMIYIVIILFAVFGIFAQKIVINYQLKYGKNILSSRLNNATFLAGEVGKLIALVVGAIIAFWGMLFHDMYEEMEKERMADEAADKYIRERVSSATPINYENELNIAYRGYINSTGTADTARNRDEFAKKYYKHIYG